MCSQLGIPAYSFFTSSATLFAFSLYLPTLDREVEGDLVDLPEPIKIPGSSSVRPEDLLEELKRRSSGEYGLCLLHISRLPLAAGIFLYSWTPSIPSNRRELFL